jgi:hypothetical protein
MVVWWNERSKISKRKYFFLRGLTILGSVTLPVLISAQDMVTLSAPVSTRADILKIMALIVSAIVAGCGAWEGVTSHGEIWREKRRSTELLKVEGWKYIQLCGEYENYPTHDAAYKLFADEVEKMI